MAIKSIVFLIFIYVFYFPILDSLASEESGPVQIELSSDLKRNGNGDDAVFYIPVIMNSTDPELSVNFSSKIVQLPLSSSSKDWRGSDQNIKLNNPRSLKLKIPATQSGYFKVIASINGNHNNQHYGDVASAYLFIASEKNAKLYSVDEFFEHIKGEKIAVPGYSVIKHINDASRSRVVGTATLTMLPSGGNRPLGSIKQVESDDDLIELRGNVYFKDDDGREIPLRYAQVNITSNNTLWLDDYVGNALTNGAGEFVLKDVKKSDVSSRRGVYLNVETIHPTYGQMMDHNSVYTHSWTSNNFSDPTTHMSMELTSATHSAIVWNSFTKAAITAVDTIHAMSWTDKLPKPNMYAHISYPYPGKTSFSSKSDWGHIIRITDADYKYPQAVYHEYGHWVMYKLYKNYLPNTHNQGDEQSHSSCASRPQHEGLSWVEGFATAYALMVDRGNTSYFTTSKSNTGGRDVEHYSCSRNANLNTDEGRVSAALWDLFDDHNDSNEHDTERGRNNYFDDNSGIHTVKLKSIFGALRKGSINLSRQNNVKDFWRALSPDLYGQQLSKARKIMNYNWADPIISD